jgi:hypothetical protein
MDSRLTGVGWNEEDIHEKERWEREGAREEEDEAAEDEGDDEVDKEEAYGEDWREEVSLLLLVLRMRGWMAEEIRDVRVRWRRWGVIDSVLCAEDAGTFVGIIDEVWRSGRSVVFLRGVDLGEEDAIAQI